MNVKQWNEMFGTKHYIYGEEPNEYVEKRMRTLGADLHVLELGCGEGRNAVFLASLGHVVTAQDQSEAGLAKLHALAEKRHVQVETIEGDVLSIHPGRTFDLVIVTFLHMPPDYHGALYTRMKELTRTGGHVIAEWFHPDQRLQGYKSGGPPHAEWLVTKEELQAAFESWRIIHLDHIVRDLREGTHHQGLASVVQILAQKP